MMIIRRKTDMEKRIMLNQLGYMNNREKIVTFVSDKPVKFAVKKSDGATCVYEGTANCRIDSESAGQVVYTGDFTSVKEDGIYMIFAEGIGESDYFVINDNPYRDLINKSIYFFYMQRCGCDLDKKYARNYAHAACHTGLATVYGSDVKLETSGGWHDAGDYGRYIVPAAMTVAQLLMAYEKYPDIEKITSNPSFTEMPAYLEEIKYELDFMMKLQAQDGRLYHKVTCRSFCSFVMPDEEKDELILSPASVTATADFAGVMAMAVRFYEPYDKEYAAKLAMAAKKAYDALDSYTLPGGFLNPEGIVTGQYEDECDEDERSFAAAAMYKAFGDNKYREDFEKIAASKIYHGYGWSDMGSYGNIEYITSGWDVTDSIKNTIIDSMLELADRLLILSENDAYGVALDKNEYIWGSNLSVCNNGIHLMDAYEITGDLRYLTAAGRQLDYILGRNPLGLCYVTGCGVTPVMRPHHRPSGFKGKPMAGMLSGGPCDWLADPCAIDNCTGMAPAKCFVDMTGSYSTNEVTIYWNSALILLMANLLKQDKL